MTNEEITPTEITDAEIVPYTEAERAKYAALPFEVGVGSFYDGAENLDELLAELPETVGLLEWTGKQIEIHGASLHLGEMDGRQTLFVVVDVVDLSTGERVAATTGAGAVMRQLNRAAQLKLFPFKCIPYQTDIGKKGRTNPLHLGAADRF